MENMHLAIILALIFSGCGGGNTETILPPSANVATGQSVLVRIPRGANALGVKAFGVNPLDVTAGATIIWINNDDLKHTVTANDAQFDSGALSTGNAFGTVLNSPGTYIYHDEFQPGLSGTIIVH